MNLLKLELMTATEKVAEALVMRGLFVEVKDGVLFFSDKCAKNDIVDVIVCTRCMRQENINGIIIYS